MNEAPDQHRDDELAIGESPPPSAGDSGAWNRVDTTIPRIDRVACTAGAVLKMTSIPLSDAGANAIGATGIVIDPGSDDYQEIIEQASRVCFVTFDPDNREQYARHLIAYSNHHGKKAPQSQRLGGPGLITVLKHVDDIGRLDAFYHEECSGLQSNIPDDILYGQTLDQPVVVRVKTADEALRPDVLEAIKKCRLEGFIFTDIKEMQVYGEGWREFVLTRKKACPEPVVYLEGTAKGIGQYYLNESNFDSRTRSCDSYIVTDALNRGTAKAIWDLRLTRIAEAHDKPHPKPEDGGLLIGIVNLQGAAKVFEYLIQQTRSTIASALPIHTVMVHTPQQMKNLDGIIFPGGWHKVQERMYHSMGITKAIRKAVRQRSMGVLLCCAGAMYGRDPKRYSEGCSAHPAGLMPYGTINNYLNGPRTVEFRVRDHEGKERLSETEMFFVGAPIFTDVDESLHWTARTKEGEIAGVEMTDPGPPCEASATAPNSRTAGHWVEGLNYYFTFGEGMEDDDE